MSATYTTDIQIYTPWRCPEELSWQVYVMSIAWLLFVFVLWLLAMYHCRRSSCWNGRRGTEWTMGRWTVITASNGLSWYGAKGLWRWILERRMTCGPEWAWKIWVFFTLSYLVLLGIKRAEEIALSRKIVGETSFSIVTQLPSLQTVPGAVGIHKTNRGSGSSSWRTPDQTKYGISGDIRFRLGAPEE